MANAKEKLTALLERQTRIKAKIEQLQVQEQKQARKDDTRLKILVGAAVLADAARHAETEELLRTILARGITAPRDKEFLKTRSLL